MTQDEQIDFEPIDFEPVQEEMSGLKSLGKGLQQGATLGFSDELSGAIQAGLDKLAPLFGGTSLQQQAKLLQAEGFTGDIGSTNLYEQARNEERQALAKAKEANSKLYLTGELAGSAVVPLGAMGKGAKLSQQVLKGAASGAGAGALTSIGTSEEMPGLKDVATDALLGGAIGGGLPLVGAGLKGLNKAVKKSDSYQFLKDLISKTREGVEFAGEEASSNLRKKALESTKNVVTAVDKSNLAKIKKRDELLSKIEDVDVKDGTVSLLAQLDNLKNDAASTALPIINNTEKQIKRIFEKGAKISGNDFRSIEEKLGENIQKAVDSSDVRLKKILEDYQGLIKDKIYSQNPEIKQVRGAIRDENEMLKLLTGEAAPDLGKYSPAEMEKLVEQTLNRLESPAGTSNFGQSQKFFEGVEKTAGVRGSKIPAFQDVGKALKLSDDLRNLELSKTINREGISQGTVTPTGIVSAATGGVKSLVGQMAVGTGKVLKNYDELVKNVLRDDRKLQDLVPKLVSQGKDKTAQMIKTIADSPDIKKRQALIFAALQQPNVRADLENIDFQPEGPSNEDSRR
jgi:hypothetical protein